MHLRFVRDLNWTGLAVLSVRAWDGVAGRSSGASGIDLVYNGGSSPLSAETADLSVQIDPRLLFVPMIQR